MGALVNSERDDRKAFFPISVPFYDATERPDVGPQIRRRHPDSDLTDSFGINQPISQHNQMEDLTMQILMR